MADSSSLFDHDLVAQSESETFIDILESAREEDTMEEVALAVSVKVEDPESDADDSLSAMSESSPSSPDSGIDGDSLDDFTVFGDIGSLVGNSSFDEILVSEEQVKSIASSLEPPLDDINVDSMVWEDPFLDLFPSLMAV